jgi:hypothetical protein
MAASVVSTTEQRLYTTGQISGARPIYKQPLHECWTSTILLLFNYLTGTLSSLRVRAYLLCHAYFVSYIVIVIYRPPLFMLLPKQATYGKTDPRPSNSLASR